MSNATDTITGVSWVGYLVAYALLARRVSYRWFDTFFQLIPFYGVFWQFRIAWRLAYLPHRDWQVRPGEQLSPWAPVPGASYVSPGAVPAVPHQPYPSNMPVGPQFSSGYGSVPHALDPYTPPR